MKGIFLALSQCRWDDISAVCSFSLSLLLYHRERRLDIKATCADAADVLAFLWLPNASQAGETFLLPPT